MVDTEFHDTRAGLPAYGGAERSDSGGGSRATPRIRNRSAVRGMRPGVHLPEEAPDLPRPRIDTFGEGQVGPAAVYDRWIGALGRGTAQDPGGLLSIRAGLGEM